MQSLKIDLLKFTGARPFTSKDGVAFVAIPLEANAVYVGELTHGRRGSAAVAALGRVGASAARAFARRWAETDRVADCAARTSKPIGESFRMDSLRVGKPDRVVAGLDGGEIAAQRIVDV